MDEQVIDTGACQSLLDMLGPDAMEELISAFFEDAAGLFRDMREALASGDSVKFSRAAHSLKGNSANFGAGRLSALSRELEFQGKGGDLGGAEEKVNALAVEYDQVHSALLAFQHEQ
ncbi:MAG TPA: Hpt domain-containing protein [Anaerolineaceae bacterium]